MILIGRFHSLSMDDFRCVAVLGRGHFGKVDQLIAFIVQKLHTGHFSPVQNFRLYCYR